MEETHSRGFELCRHFFLRFFDSEFVTTPGQWKVVAGGALALVLSLGIIYVQAYYHKYLILNRLPTAEPYQSAVLADVLFITTFAMSLMGLFTTLQWPSLFPGLRDYLALAGLPVRMSQVFLAKFTALLSFAALFVAAINFLPSLILPMDMSGDYYGFDAMRQIPAMLVSCSLASWFVFFSLVALQGVLLNTLPVRWFPRASLTVQGGLLAFLLCGLPLVFSIPDLQPFMRMRPPWAVWAPPLWFLGLDQVIVGNHEPFAVRLAALSLEAVVGAAALAVFMYMWSYRRHRVRLLESPTVESAPGRAYLAKLSDRFIRDPRELGVFAFVGKMLSRSRQHRLVLTAFAAIALALIVESFVSLAAGRSFRGFNPQTPGLREAVISAPLALSLFVLAGYRYLFRLPVDLQANWVFRTNEHGNRLAFLNGVEDFLLYCGVIPAALVTLPLDIRFLGLQAGCVAAVVCLAPSLILMELLLSQFDRIPFTSSYLPGQRPLVETVVRYAIAVALYVSVLSIVIDWCLQSVGATLALLAAFLPIWWRVRSARRELRQIGQIEFEELPEPAVLTLSIDRD
jgi:hypothetical protein